MRRLYDEYVILQDTLEWSVEAGALVLEGEIALQQGIVIGVRKTLEILADPSGSTDEPDEAVLVHTVMYAYNAFVRGHHNFLRHDNAHGRPGHEDKHHFHRFDWRSGTEELGSPVWCGEKNWPTLAQFIRTVHGWWLENAASLPPPPPGALLSLR